ncbi:MAG: cupredoxin domain-containing protein [Candidatus Limnocylindria bacterium]
MNPYRLLLLSASLVLVLAACAPAAAQPSSQPSDASSREASPEASASLLASESSQPSNDPSSTPGASASTASNGEMALIEIENFAFSPAQLTISAGTEVTVTNLDSAPHTFTAGTDAAPEPDVFDSGLLQQGESFTFVFDEAGTFAYYCDRHPPMQGEITVTN